MQNQELEAHISLLGDIRYIYTHQKTGLYNFYPLRKFGNYHPSLAILFVRLCMDRALLFIEIKILE